MVEAYAGVPHLKGDAGYNRSLKNIAASTRPEAGRLFGGFSALYDLNGFAGKKPLLVASTDGVGTKLELANLQGRHDTVGIDLVAMCVNDLITCGAKPLFFLDYFASGVFNRKKTIEVLQGIAAGCREADCALIGGETAIMPGFYPNQQYDMAGFSVGVVNRSEMIQPGRVKPGDILLGFESSGFHSNGFSLLRKVFSKKELSGKIGKKLLVPTQIYVRPVLDLIKRVRVHGIAHITGGGFYDNIPRVLPKGLGVQLNRGSWPVDPIFFEVQKRAKYSERQMAHTFNMGIGMTVILKKTDAPSAQVILRKHKVDVWQIGEVKKGEGVVIL